MKASDLSGNRVTVTLRYPMTEVIGFLEEQHANAREHLDAVEDHLEAVE